MNADQPSRRLAAILVADIAGYSALMGADEAGTVAALKGHQAVILPMISAQGGRVIDMAGDGILAEFGSVVAAVNCAFALQAAIAERNRGVVPERRMEFRIGINQGDVVYDDARIYGDGINVAARLQALAQPGEICISGKVHEEVRDRVDAAFRDLGEQALKNIARPVRVFAIVPGSTDGADAEPTRAEAAPSMVVPSVAVLPFANLSGDLEQEYFADGVVDDIITALSRFKSFAVIARNSSFTYKGRSVDVRQVAKELDVRYVLEGSVRRAGDRLRISAQLVDGSSGAHLWGQIFDGTAADIFAFQDRITESVVGIVEPNIEQAEIERRRREPPQSLTAYDLYLRAQPYLHTSDPGGRERGVALLEQVLLVAPNDALALAWNARTRYAQLYFGRPMIGDMATIRSYVERAERNAANDARVLALCAHLRVDALRDYPGALAMMRAAVETNPNNIYAAHAGGLVNLHCGDLDEAVMWFERACRLDPRHHEIVLPLGGLAHVALVRGQYELSIEWALKAAAKQNSYPFPYWMLSAANAHLGRLEEARYYLRELQHVAPNTTIASIRASQPTMIPGRIEPVLEGLRLAGLPEDTPSAPVLPSLAVLPFQNLSGDVEQEYFADGVVEDIITALSRFRSFAVIARNSSFTYKGRAIDVRTVAKELNIRYVLEGSVRKSGNQLRIAAQLVDGTTGAHIWAQNFDGVLGDVFAFQDRITESVVGVVEPQVQRAELARAQRERPGSVAAYDLYLRALPVFTTMSDPTNREAHDLVVRALKLEPDNVVYMALIVDLLQHRAGMGWPPIGPDDRAASLALVTRALAMAGNDAVVLGMCGNAFVQWFREYDRGVALLRRSLELNPNNFLVLCQNGVAQLHCGDLEESIMLFQRASRLNPLDATAALSDTGIAHAKLVQGKYDEAIIWARRGLAFNSRYDPVYWMLAAANALLGRMDEARTYRGELQRLAPRTTIASIRSGQPAKFPDRIEPILEGLRLAGLPEG